MPFPLHLTEIQLWPKTNKPRFFCRIPLHRMDKTMKWSINSCCDVCVEWSCCIAGIFSSHPFCSSFLVLCFQMNPSFLPSPVKLWQQKLIACHWGCSWPVTSAVSRPLEMCGLSWLPSSETLSTNRGMYPKHTLIRTCATAFNKHTHTHVVTWTHTFANYWLL